MSNTSPNRIPTMVSTEAPKEQDPFDPRTLVREAVAGAVSEIPAVGAALAKVGGTRALWGAIILLAGALGLHVLDSRRITRMEELIGWLVLCEEARQNDTAPPPLPFKLRIP